MYQMPLEVGWICFIEQIHIKNILANPFQLLLLATNLKNKFWASKQLAIDYPLKITKS